MTAWRAEDKYAPVLTLCPWRRQSQLLPPPRLTSLVSNDKSCLWDVDKLINTPHISSEYVGHYLRAEPLINVIDKERDY